MSSLRSQRATFPSSEAVAKTSSAPVAVHGSRSSTASACALSNLRTRARVCTSTALTAWSCEATSTAFLLPAVSLTAVMTSSCSRTELEVRSRKEKPGWPSPSSLYDRE